MTAVEWFVNLLAVYAAAGVVFGIAFVTAGVQKVDPAAKGSGFGFRLILLPGAAALWPFLLLRWIERGSGRP